MGVRDLVFEAFDGCANGRQILLQNFLYFPTKLKRVLQQRTREAASLRHETRSAKSNMILTATLQRLLQQISASKCDNETRRSRRRVPAIESLEVRTLLTIVSSGGGQFSSPDIADIRGEEPVPDSIPATIEDTGAKFNTYSTESGNSMDGTTGSDSFVLTYSSTSTAGTVGVTVSTNGGPIVNLGTFPMNTPLTVNGLGGTDSVRIVGTSSADTFTVISSGINVNGASLILSSIEERTLAAMAGSDVYKFDTDAALGFYKLDEAAGGIDTIDFSLTANQNVSLHIAVSSPQVINSNLSLQLGSGLQFERAVGGAGDDSLTGNSLANILTGNVGDDILNGGLGSDQLIGGTGDDTYVFGGTSSGGEVDRIVETPSLDADTLDFSSRTTPVTVNISTGGQQSVHSGRKLVLDSGLAMENVIGGSAADSLTGNSRSNTLTGNAGHDRLSGGLGSDLLIGGQGNDTYVFGGATSGGEVDTIVEASSLDSDTLDFSSRSIPVTINIAVGAQQTVHTDRAIKLNSGLAVENVIGGSGADSITGNSRTNILTGNAGDDILNGGLGSDQLIGGTGDDTYVFGGTSSGGEVDTIVEASSLESDTLDFSSRTTPVTVNISTGAQQSVHSGRRLVLGSGLAMENVIGGSAADSLTGNSRANTLTGNAGHDRLSGGLGSDLVIGGEGNDTYVFGGATSGGEVDSIVEQEGAGLDTLDFSSRTTSVNLNLGNPGQQTVHVDRAFILGNATAFENILGGSADDTLTGNSVANVLVGNGGDDQLSGGSGRDLLIGGDGLDTIQGGNDEDVLIAGSTVHDTLASSLNTLLTAWQSSESYAARVTSLTAGVGAPVIRLQSLTTVLNDNDDDILTGGASLDWYFQALDELITDLLSGEISTVL